MKSAWILVCLFLLVAVPALAEPAQEPLTREAIAQMLGLTKAPGSCGQAAAPSQIVFAAQKPGPGGGVSQMATCSALCETGSVQCTGNISCHAYNRNCTTDCEKGHVTCNDTVNGTTTVWCPTACPGGFCCNCAQTGSCYDCCRCDGGGLVQCNNCCACQATADCVSCCRCEGGSLSHCNSICFPQ